MMNRDNWITDHTTRITEQLRDNIVYMAEKVTALDANVGAKAKAIVDQLPENASLGEVDQASKQVIGLIREYGLLEASKHESG